LLAAAACVAPSPGAAHPLAPSLLELRASQGSPGEVTVRWKTPLQGPSGMRLVPELPRRCRETSTPKGRRDGTGWVETWTMDCGAEGLAGARVGVSGLGPEAGGVVVRVVDARGRATQRLLSAARPAIEVPAGGRPLALVGDYAALGVRHLVFGWDHALFVLGLLLLVRGPGALILTVTAFTLGHSITLSLAALGHVNARPAWIEVAIAATLVLLAAEIAQAAEGRAGALGRRPARMAALFGLLHGLGFAAALAEIGLPPDEIPLALLGFNAGIELGQLGLVLAALAAWRATRPLRRARAARRTRLVAAYALGTVAGWWLLERLAWALGPR
jgi:hypothetical protein